MQFLFRSLNNRISLIPSKVYIPMERVAALVEKITNQLAQKADKSQLKQTAVQLLAELSETDQFNNLPNNVSVMIPGVNDTIFESMPNEETVAVRIPSLPKLEPEALAHKEDTISPTSPISNSNLPIEINATVSTTELQEKLALDPIKDLKSAIGINDKFQFIETLFGGDEKAFDQAVKSINGFKIYAEAQFWVKSNLREQYKWDDSTTVVKSFDLLVKRRFA